MKITFSGKVTAHKLVEKKEQVEDGEPIVHEGLELTVDAEASHLSDLCAADAKSKVRLLVRKSDAARYPLGAIVSTTIELTQGEAFAPQDEEEDLNVEITVPGHEPVKTSTARMNQAAKNLSRGRAPN